MTPEYPRSQVTGLILAGGQALRMGGRDKGLLEYRGQALVCAVRERLAGQTGRILLSANRNLQRYASLGFSPLPDLRDGYNGPLAGIEAAISACETSYLLVTPCDTPEIPDDLGPRLWQAMMSEQAEVAYAVDAERQHYLHALLPVALAQDLSDYLDAGGAAVRRWYAQHSAATATFETGCFLNLNAPDQQN